MVHKTVSTRVAGTLIVAATAVVMTTGATVADASVVVTQLEAETSPPFWLLNLGGQQGIAHSQVVNDHSVSAVGFFDESTLSGVDVVYFSPARFFLTPSEIEAIAAFVDAGGRLILAAEHGGVVSQFPEIAAHFDVSYGGILDGGQTATVTGFDNTVTNGPAGMVNEFSAVAPNNGLMSTNPDFSVVANYAGGEVALGYLPVGAGEVVFLTDQNTFDDARLGDLDNQTLWTNLFEYTAVALLDLDIKPGSCPNPLNRFSNGVIPVGLLGDAGFDITQVDVSTVVISRADGVGGSVGPNEGPPGPHSVFADVGTPLPPNGTVCGCHDLEGDGITDLSMKFRTQEVVDALQLGDFSGGDLVELVVSGELLDGRPFTASDCVVIVPPGSAMRSMSVTATSGGAWVQVEPMDVLQDGGGFADFQRVFLSGTPVSLTASATHEGQTFLGWRVDGGPLLTGQTLSITATASPRWIEAVYVELVPVNERPIDAGGRPVRR